ncbi:MAG: branched-chain amino acid ABC transporter permease [Nitrososphaerota archaeon]|nr:branched-chain amino acid ABC transporter permease [Nitrososphaerota archaeon]
MDYAYGIYTSIVTGLSYGLVVSLLAAGFSLVFGVMGNLNMAHGTFYMFGAFATYVISSYFGVSPILSIAASIAIVFLISLGTLVGFVPKKMWVTSIPNEQALVMILLLAFTTVASQVVFFMFGGTPINTPPVTTVFIQLPGRLYLDGQLLVSIIFALASYLILGLFLGYTHWGKAIRAYSQDKESAEAIGINGQRTTMLVFGIGGALAAVSGSLLSSIYAVDPTTGLTELLIAFIIVMLGGVGSILGSIVGGLIYGVTYEALQFFYSQYTFIVLFLLIYIVIIIRPSGLFGKVASRV